MQQYNENCLRDLQGKRYTEVLKWVHTLLKPDLYFEIGTLTGDTLQLSTCESVAVDPQFRLQGVDVAGIKPILHLYQKTSDDFFAKHGQVFEGKIHFAFLDGMHRCEFLLRDFYNTERCAKVGSVISMHDCLPLDIPMAGRDQFGFTSEAEHRAGWWTGDVWRTVVALKKFRPDLKITCLDAEPTGLVFITRLDPCNTELTSRYDEIVAYMYSLDLAAITVQRLHEQLGVQRVPSMEALLGTLL